MIVSTLLRKIKTAPHTLYRRYVERPLNQRHCYDYPSCNNDWQKVGNTPVWGNLQMGTMFDPYAFLDGGEFKMVVSARKDKSIILISSKDGIHWSDCQLLLQGADGKWDDNVNRGCLLQHEDKYYLWYTGQIDGKASIGLATSADGATYNRVQDVPVLTAETINEGMSVMNPCVLWNEERQIFQMWYSAGETYEPDVICYAESKDGICWTKRPDPVLVKFPVHEWEKYKVGGCQVIREKDCTYTIYYIGYQNVDVARICIAHSKDGINWVRPENNLLIAPSKAAWDSDAAYKPTVVEKNSTLYMWYNGRRAHEEYIGLAIKKL